MKGRVIVIGVDPGPIPGVAVLNVCDGQLLEVDVLQCSPRLLYPIVGELMRLRAHRFLAVERFVVRGRATKDQGLTRDQVAALQTQHPGTIQRSASEVKPWATDARLEAAGLLEACKGMRHARDAARHALFAAVHDGGLPDPLSKEFRR